MFGPVSDFEQLIENKWYTYIQNPSRALAYLFDLSIRDHTICAQSPDAC